MLCRVCCHWRVFWNFIISVQNKQESGLSGHSRVRWFTHTLQPLCSIMGGSQCGCYSPPHLCMSNEVRQEARCTTRRKRFKTKTKSPLFWGNVGHVQAAALPCTVIWYKQAHKSGGLPDGVVSQTVLIKIWWVAPSWRQRVPRLHSKSMRRNQPIFPVQQPNSSASWKNTKISGRLLLSGWMRCTGSRRVSE